MAANRTMKALKGSLSNFANVRPLFTRPTPWWGTTFGTAGLILCNVVITGTAAHSTWNYWTEPNTVTKLNDKGEQVQTIQWDLRPTWQRAGLCFGHILAGCMFAGGLLAKKALYIRSVYLVSPATSGRPASSAALQKSGASDPRRLIIQSASETNDTGYEFPLRGSWLEAGQSEDEVILRSGWEGLHSRFQLRLRGALVDGQAYGTPLEARNKLADEWRNLLPAAPSTTKRSSTTSS